ncbi:hypothetical protein [Sediminibacterium soli]|uniref:hypothetical protein n=1 Tax=Sediminibacterium soli TaxID=2698829 RepID=UPI0013794859|nr:hypothetical protein [Sediminibacterium soli]NCI48246.1 hypothetical protein [Sediminibacterium soli]
MKRTAQGDQVLDLNRIDFERAGSARKAGYKFSIEFTNGKVANVISNLPMAPELAVAMQDDPVIRDLISSNNYVVSLNTRYQLSLKNISQNGD